jgi:radical SAM superfamily enzyme YgiQ (UPF0313 family)
MAGKRLDVVLVNPGDRSEIYQQLGATLAAIESPVWVGLIASYAREKGLSVEIIDANAEGLTPEQTAERIIDLDPLLTSVIVYGHNPSASTQVMPSAGAICSFLKRRDPARKVVLVGGHVAALPERTLQEEATDFVAGGEGLYTIVDLVHALRANDTKGVLKVRGLWHRTDGRIAFTTPAPLVQNLDREMPGMAYDLLPNHLYRAHNWHAFETMRRQPYTALYTTFGCPYHCSFCCIQAPFREGEQALGFRDTVNSYRFWSPPFVVDTLEMLVERYGVRNVKFADEMFVLNRRHVEGICDLIIERGLGDHLNIWAYARVDTVKDGMTDKLIRAGFRWLCFGIESGSARVRQDVDKGFDQDIIFRTIENVGAVGIHVIANYIFGLPEDDRTSMQETLDLALSLNTEFANFYSAMAYPGSELYDLAVKEGLPLPDRWSGYSQHAVDTRPLPTKYLSGAEVLAFRDHAFQVYFTNPAYLALVERKFGSGAVAHIREMASYKLARKHVPLATS